MLPQSSAVDAAPEASRHDCGQENAGDPEYEADEKASDRVLGDRLLRRERRHVGGVDDATPVGHRLRRSPVTLNRGVYLLHRGCELLAVVEQIGIRRSLPCLAVRGRFDRGVVRFDPLP